MIMNKIIDSIKKAKKIAVTFHTSCDGDSLGSANALVLALRELNKDCYIMCKEKCPKLYDYLPLSKEIDGSITKIERETDLVIVLDCGNLERINGDLKIDDRNYVLINIDHHVSNDNYADINYIDTNAAAVSEIIYQLIYLLDLKINEPIGRSLYTSIMTDTGNFKFSNTTSNTHIIAGDLINAGIDFSDINRRVYENKSIKRIKFYGEVIDTLESYYNDKVITVEINKELSEKYLKDENDSGDVLSIPSSIGSAELILMFKEVDRGVKISFRSKTYIDVRELAEKFGGGGHVRASGGFREGTLKEVKEDVLKELEKYEWCS